jgi:hypothetical protein
VLALAEPFKFVSPMVSFVIYAGLQSLFAVVFVLIAKYYVPNRE